MRQYMVEILRISSSLMVFFYRRFLPLDVFIYAFGAENDASSSNLSIPLFKLKGLSQILHLRQPLFYENCISLKKERIFRSFLLLVITPCLDFCNIFFKVIV